jgi:FtsP/CotA-like multicopper oxidase with cupredoxin domain
MNNRFFFIGGVSLLLLSLFITYDTTPFSNTPLLVPPSSVPVAHSTSVVLNASPYDLTLLPRQFMIDDAPLSLMTYNGQLPGPTFIAQKGSKHTIRVHNTLPYETTVHWHGLRLEHRFDGVPDVTQAPIKPNASFTYELMFPDEGVFWYHPHVREDFQQEGGLYGMIQVVDKDGPRALPLVLDDISIRNGSLTPFFGESITHALMGRFGNRYLINGREQYSLQVNDTEPVYLALLNVANVRPFRLTIPGATMTLVRGELGLVSEIQDIDSLVLGPAERAVVRVTFPQAGTYPLLNDNPLKTSTLGRFEIKDPTKKTLVTPSVDRSLSVLAEQHRLRDPDHTLSLALELEGFDDLEVHPEDRIEWEDTMPGMAVLTNATVHWKLIDNATGKENMDLNYYFPLGSYQKIRIVNSLESPHPMHHPIHFHGQRFLILSHNGAPVAPLSWEDTVLVGMGDTIDILLEVSNPGTWMIHCHIAEHLQSGMMASFTTEVSDSKKKMH